MIARVSRLLVYGLLSTVPFICISSPVVRQVPDPSKPAQLYLEPSTIEVGDRRYASEQGSVVVHENPLDTSSRRIMLPVLRILSPNKNAQEPIFWLNGGPGLSNMKYRPFTPLLENHDIVLVGYRGVDGSVVLNSDEIQRALEGTDGYLPGDESLRSLSEALRSFSDRLKAQHVDLAHYTMVEVISDLECVRKALGYARINLSIMSYGTRLALLYSHLHPEVVFRSVMIGANPPGRFAWDPRKVDEQLIYYDSLFAADSLSYDGRLLSHSMRTALARMPAQWSLFRLDPGKIRAISFALLYHKRSAAVVFQCYRAAEEADYSGLYALQRAYDFKFPGSLVWGDVFAKGSADFDSTMDYVRVMRDSQTVLGSPFSLMIWGSAVDHWPIYGIEPDLRKGWISDTPTLIVSGSVDFSTPAAYATNELLPYLPHGKQVILREMGHVEDLLTLQRSALVHLLVRFFDDGIVDDSRFRYDPMDFDPPVNLPRWTKVLYPLVTLLSFIK
jgi:pimeloyl-ACP methyl ester carboxylesterase